MDLRKIWCLDYWAKHKKCSADLAASKEGIDRRYFRPGSFLRICCFLCLYFIACVTVALYISDMICSNISKYWWVRCNLFPWANNNWHQLENSTKHIEQWTDFIFESLSVFPVLGISDETSKGTWSLNILFFLLILLDRCQSTMIHSKAFARRQCSFLPILFTVHHWIVIKDVSINLFQIKYSFDSENNTSRHHSLVNYIVNALHTAKCE